MRANRENDFETVMSINFALYIFPMNSKYIPPFFIVIHRKFPFAVFIWRVR